MKSPNPKSNSAGKLKKKQLQRGFILARESPQILEMLVNARPLAGRTWNAYVAAITADPKRADLYVKNLLSLVDEIISELDPDKCSPEILPEIKKYARDRVTWPGFILKHEALEINVHDGRRRKPAASGAPAQIAEMLLDQLRNEIAHFSVSHYSKRSKWDYYYVCPTPPEYHSGQSEEWRLLAATLLDINHGPDTIRRAARKTYLEAQQSNPIPLPQGRNKSLTDRLNDLKNQKAQDPDFIETQLRNWETRDNFGKGTPEEKLPKNTKTDTWEEEELPCILAHPFVKQYCRNLLRRTSDKNEVRSAKAAYNQLKKEVLRAVKDRLPKQPAITP